ncbi:MAG: lipid-A-disaccharide synthase [Salaquimonas sp.]|nr:lipid-A-disaccharide synthase [Salaquimonas sp.]
MAEAITAYLVVGEASGDVLGAELAEALRRIAPDAQFRGLAGPRMQKLGLSSLFDISDISVMGLAGVVARIPTLIRRIGQVTDDIVTTKPDVLVLIDSPDFNLRVAKRVRARLPDLKIVKYVCPSVWAWRPGRASAMRGIIDHVLTLLPFEPNVLAELGGPAASYVGHPLASRLGDVAPGDRMKPADDPLLLVLPGSRRSEVKLLLPDIRDTLAIMDKRSKEHGATFRAVLPAVPHLKAEIERAVASWPVKPEVISGEAAKNEAFADADAALAASGTVLLELALHRIPMVSIYRLDWLMHLVRHLITGWSAALPNLITDETFLPERVGDMIRPGWLARALEELMRDSMARQAQLQGFERMAQAMKTQEPSGILAARAILAVAKGKTDQGLK